MNKHPKVNPAASLNMLEQLTEESKQETEAKTRETSVPKVKAEKAANALTGNGWSREWKQYLAKADEYKQNASVKTPGVQVWLDEDLKKQLDKLRASGLKYPIRQLLNAAVAVLFERCSSDIEKQLQD